MKSSQSIILSCLSSAAAGQVQHDILHYFSIESCVSRIALHQYNVSRMSGAEGCAGQIVSCVSQRSAAQR